MFPIDLPLARFLGRDVQFYAGQYGIAPNVSRFPFDLPLKPNPKQGILKNSRCPRVLVAQDETYKESAQDERGSLEAAQVLIAVL